MCRDVPRPDAPASAGARNAGQGKRGATRTHAQRRLRREHGEDGEHWTLTGVSTPAPRLLARRIMNMPFDRSSRLGSWFFGSTSLRHCSPVQLTASLGRLQSRHGAWW